MDKQQRRKPNPEELRAAARIKEAWLQKKKKSGMNQEAAAGLLGWSQSLFGMYVNGNMPLTIEPVLKLSKFLGQPAMLLAPEICEPYANDINRLSVNKIVQEQCEVIESLESRLLDAGQSSLAANSNEHQSQINEIVEILKTLPPAETSLTLYSLKQRQSLVASLKPDGKAAKKAKSNLSHLKPNSTKRP